MFCWKNWGECVSGWGIDKNLQINFNWPKYCEYQFSIVHNITKLGHNCPLGLLNRFIYQKKLYKKRISFILWYKTNAIFVEISVIVQLDQIYPVFTQIMKISCIYCFQFSKMFLRECNLHESVFLSHASPHFQHEKLTNSWYFVLES